MAEFLEGAGKRASGTDCRDILPRSCPNPEFVMNKGGSRARTYFIREVSRCFIRDVTGRWLDEQVAMITAIAFNT